MNPFTRHLTRFTSRGATQPLTRLSQRPFTATTFTPFNPLAPYPSTRINPLSQSLSSLRTQPLHRYYSPQQISLRTFAAKTEPPAVPAASGRFTAEEEAFHREIERWGASFDITHVKRSHLEFSFARSSGPGGQNVNKVSSKAQARFILDDADWIHASVRKRMKESHARYITKNMDNRYEFYIQSEVHRTQEANSEECIKKIYEVIKECCAVPKETSDAQKKKVAKMIDAQKKKDIEAKKRLKEKKSDRRGGRE